VLENAAARWVQIFLFCTQEGGGLLRKAGEDFLTAGVSVSSTCPHFREDSVLGRLLLAALQEQLIPVQRL